MPELPNREIKRDEFMHRLINDVCPQFENEDMDFLFKENAKRKEICEDICTERMFQIATWGKDPYPVYKGLSVLTEEVGEANKAVLEDQPQTYRSELVQVAAVCMRLIEELDSFKLSADSFGCTREMLPEKDEWRELTEKEKAAIVLDEMAKSDDPLKRQGAEAISVMISAKMPDKPTGYLNGKIEAIEKRLDEHFAEIKRLTFVIESIAPRLEILEQPSPRRPSGDAPTKKPMRKDVEIRALPFDGSIEPYNHYLFEDPSGDFRIYYTSTDRDFLIPPCAKVYKLEIDK